jgi:predicted deacetylase
MSSPSLAVPSVVGGPFLIVSVHDVGPATAAASRRWVELTAGLHVPLTFLIVPGPWRGARFGAVGDDGHDQVGWLRSRQERGDEMSVHGWTHRADAPGSRGRQVIGSVLARGAAELWGLDRRSAGVRTAAGLEVLDRHGLRVTGSTPPGWLASRAAKSGLADAGVQYVTDHTGLSDLATGRRWWAPALCHRPATSPAGRGAAGRGAVGVEGVGRRVLGLGARLVTTGASVRIALHPADLDRPGLADAAIRAVQHCLGAGAEPTTYADVLRRLRSGG